MKSSRIQSVLAILILSVTANAGLEANAGGSVTFKWGRDADTGKHHVKHGKKVKKGPPAHAPAHGYRARHQYRYYPACKVYHDADRGLYFYMSGERWEVGVSLPDFLQGDLGAGVSLELETENPYVHNGEHVKKYPPGRYRRKKI